MNVLIDSIRSLDMDIIGIMVLLEGILASLWICSLLNQAEIYEVNDNEY